MVGGDFLHRPYCCETSLQILLLLLLEHGERLHKVEQGPFVHHAVDKHLEFAYEMRSYILAILAFPRRETAEACRKRACPRFKSIGNDNQCIVGEERRNLLLIGFNLAVCTLYSGILICCVLQLEDDQGQTVNEQQYIGTAVVPVLDDSKLVYNCKFVVVWVVEVDEPHAFATLHAVLVYRYGNAVGKQTMKFLVIGQNIGRTDT